MSDVQELQDLLARARLNRTMPPQPRGGQDAPSKTVEKQDTLEHIQWEVLPNGAFAAAGSTQPHLNPGAYLVGMTDRGPIFISKKS